MHTRRLPPPESSFFLLGARGTGKTTWIQQHFCDAVQCDLLLASESIRLSRDPSLFRQECMAQPDGAWSGALLGWTSCRPPGPRSA